MLNVVIWGGGSEAKLRRRTSHKPNRRLMRENKGFFSFAFDSAHVEYGVWTWPKEAQCLFQVSRFFAFLKNCIRNPTLVRRRRGRRLLKICLSFALEFRIYLELYSMPVCIKTCPRWICYKCGFFQIEMRRVSGRGESRCQETWFAKKCTKNYYAPVQPLLYSLNYFV